MDISCIIGAVFSPNRTVTSFREKAVILPLTRHGRGKADFPPVKLELDLAHLLSPINNIPSRPVCAKLPDVAHGLALVSTRLEG